jgi:hypothetical protein
LLSDIGRSLATHRTNTRPDGWVPKLSLRTSPLLPSIRPQSGTSHCAGELSQHGSVTHLLGGRIPELVGSNFFGDVATLAIRNGGFDQGASVATDAALHAVPRVAGQTGTTPHEATMDQEEHRWQSNVAFRMPKLSPLSLAIAVYFFGGCAGVGGCSLLGGTMFFIRMYVAKFP